MVPGGGAAGTGNGTQPVAIAANGSTSGRSGTLTVAGRGIPVTQAGVAAPCTIVVSPTSASIGAAGGSATVAVSAGNGCDWTIASDASWLTTSGPVNGSGNRNVTYNVAANSSSNARTGHLHVGDATLTVSQAAGQTPPQTPACSYQVSPVTATVVPAGGQASATVTAGSGCGWTAKADVNWITVNSGAIGSGNGTVTYTVAANNGQTRTGTLTIAGKTLTVTQTGAPCTYALTPATKSFDDKNHSDHVSIDTQPGCAWTATSSASWLVIDLTDLVGLGDKNIDYDILRNTSATSRTATITVAGQVSTITQAGVK
jgi:hypothetical protein